MPYPCIQSLNLLFVHGPGHDPTLRCLDCIENKWFAGVITVSAYTQVDLLWEGIVLEHLVESKYLIRRSEGNAAPYRLAAVAQGAKD